MKHLSVRPAAAKLMISCEAFVAAAVLGVVLFLKATPHKVHKLEIKHD